MRRFGCRRHSISRLDSSFRTSGIPGLHSKKYDEARDIWQARVTRDWRFYFTIEGDAIKTPSRKTLEKR